MLLVLQIGILCLLLVSTLICFYYWFLLFASFLPKKEAALVGNDDISTFLRLAVVVPAHNEEAVISQTLQTCLRLDYPTDRYDIFVVADNCSDATADVAGSYGVTVLERYDPVNRGKGHALSFAFDHVLKQGFDAVLVLDADCRIDGNALQVVDRALREGDKVIQINNRVSNPDESVMAYALAVGNTIENDFFYSPKSSLGLSVFLRGTGMVFHRQVLVAHPWSAHSIVEDIEYTLTLLRAGYRIRFLSQVQVQSPFPVDPDQLQVQRSRWASGNLGFGRKVALQLMWQGVRERNLIFIDAGWTFLVMSRPLVLLLLGMALAVAIWTNLVAPTSSMQQILACLIANVVLLSGYFTAGILKLGLSCHRLVLLSRVPLTVLHLIAISLRGLISVKKKDWVRTPR